MTDNQAHALAALVKGSRVCEVGYGTANLVHRHRVVHHVTKTQIVTEVAPGVFTRFHRENGSSMPYMPYGGTTIHPTCQRKKGQPGS